MLHNFIRQIKSRARKNPQRIVFPEGINEKILQATEIVLKEKFAKITLIGNPRIIKAKAKKLKLKIDWKKLDIIDPETSKLTDKYAKIFLDLRKDKGIKSLSEARKIVKGMDYFGTMMIYMDDADGMVTGTIFSTGESIRPALQIIKTKEKFHKVSGLFFMVLEHRLLAFADAAITVEPDAHDLVDIAVDTAETAKQFGIEPKIAFLSFSTKGSARHPAADKVREAAEMLKYERSDIVADGELQVDAALVPEVAKRKAPNSIIQGDANVLIFPNLESANIAYKLVERLAHAKAIGPLLQGLKKPINKVSRGCNYKDIVNVTAFTVCQCHDKE
ncbi:MAG: phosphate acetyltransferase [Candidatus Gracilibacteria bacterium]|jgi:phosphate acetyltransferase